MSDSQMRDNAKQFAKKIVFTVKDIRKEHRIDILKNSVEYFIKAPMDEQYIYYTVKNIIRLMQTNRTVSPLTG